MNTKELFSTSKTFPRIIYVLGLILIILILLKVGMAVGYWQAVYSNRLDREYFGGIDDRHSAFNPFIYDSSPMNPHGAVGDIISIKTPSLMIKGPDADEEVIAISPDTTIRRGHAMASTSDFVVGQRIIIIGAVDDGGVMHASFVRILGEASSSMMGMPGLIKK